MTYTNTTGMRSVTECFSPYMDWSKINADVLQAACERGSRVHRAIEGDLQGEFPMLPDDEKGYLDAARKFLDNVTEIILVEKRLISDAYQFTGQVDLVCRIDGDARETVIDWKTSTSLSKSWSLQLAAYAHLVRASAYPIRKDARHMAIQLRKNGSYFCREYTNPAHDFALFLNCLTAYRYFNPKPSLIDWEAL